MTQALIVIDVQNDFCPGGALEVADGDAVVAVINGLMRQFDCVILTQDWHPADHSSFASQHQGQQPFGAIELSYGTQVLWPDHCVQGSRGAEFHKDLHSDTAHAVIRKGFRRDIDSYSAFLENDRKTSTGLSGLLRELGVKQLFLCGLATDFCVNYSAMDGRALGFDVTVIEDACRAIDMDGSLKAALEDMQAAGVQFTTAPEIS